MKILSENNKIDLRNVVNDSSEVTARPTESMSIPEQIQQPFVCFNKSQVAPDPKKVYGYFSRDIIVKSRFDKIS